MKAVENEVCFTEDYLIAKISSLRTFCAGGMRYGPCSGGCSYLCFLLFHLITLFQYDLQGILVADFSQKSATFGR